MYLPILVCLCRLCPACTYVAYFQEATEDECGHDTLDAHLIFQDMVLFLFSVVLFFEHGIELA